MRYGGIYRSPPKPQRQEPNATLPSEVFPDPSVGNIGRRIITSIIRMAWIWVPQPQRSKPVVTAFAGATAILSGNLIPSIPESGMRGG